MAPVEAPRSGVDVADPQGRLHPTKLGSVADIVRTEGVAMAGLILGEQEGGGSRFDPGSLAKRAAAVVGAVGVMLLAGAIIDLVTLWMIQRQDTLEWELVALGTTTNSFPILGLGVVLLYAYLVLNRSESLAKYRVVSVLAVMVGLVGFVVGFLVATNYLAVTKAATIRTEAVPIFKSIVVKTGGISAVYGTLMVGAGLLALRRPKS